MTEWGIAAAAAVIGALLCRFVARRSIEAAPKAVMRTNVDGKQVPVVLGWAVVAGALAALTTVVVVGTPGGNCPGLAYCDGPGAWVLWGAAGVPLAGMFLAGFWDDLRGDERPRGFAGHLGALGGGALTGGAVKLLAGGLVGLVTAVIAVRNDLGLLVPMALLVALTANLVNLVDRAPGRALKLFLIVALPLALVGDETWRLLAAGAIGAAGAALPLDLRARAMLGDAGANPLGALLGLGLAASLAGSRPVLWGVVVVVAALNLASERWSFSEVIAKNAWLARLDHLGRK